MSGSNPSQARNIWCGSHTFQKSMQDSACMGSLACLIKLIKYYECKWTCSKVGLDYAWRCALLVAMQAQLNEFIQTWIKVAAKHVKMGFGGCCHQCLECLRMGWPHCPKPISQAKLGQVVWGCHFAFARLMTFMRPVWRSAWRSTYRPF